MNENKFEDIIISMVKDLREEFRDLRQEFKDLRGEFKELRQDVSTMKTDVGWMKGKLEGKAETRHVVLTGISIAVAIAAVILAWLK